jgi:hypothetical protein
MVSLLADIAICAAILAGAYFWLGGRNSVGSGSGSSSSKKKKNKSKSKAKAAANDVAPVVPEKSQQPPKEASREEEKPAAVQPAQPEQPYSKNGANQKPKHQQPTKNRHTQGQAWRASEEFPPLSATVAKAQSQPQKPLAERLAKPVPKTAVDDMLDREVEPERTFSRTMRIVKPAPSPPLLIDDPNEEEEKDSADLFAERDSRAEKEPAWESVPITSQKSKSARTCTSRRRY